MATTIQLEFMSRRQNSNDGDDQFRIWTTRANANLVAQHVPALQQYLNENRRWTRRVLIRWRNGKLPRKMTLGAYKDQAGELSFTAAKRTALFAFAKYRHNNGTENEPFVGVYHLSAAGDQDVIVLDLELDRV